MINYNNKKKTLLTKELNEGTFNVVLTSDDWPGWAKQDYVSVVGHYIDSTWINHTDRTRYG